VAFAQDQEILPDPAANPRAPLRSAETILLDRLKSEPVVKEQAPTGTLAVILGAVVLMAIGIYLYSKKEDVFSAAPPPAPEHHAHSADSLKVLQQRVALQPTIDSLRLVLAANPEDIPAQLHLANALYDAEFWPESMQQYEAYLEHVPGNADARVDYGFAIARAEGDMDRAVEEMERALTYSPDHVNALFNAGILSLRNAKADRTAAFEQARGYFARARKAAKDPVMQGQIDQILAEMEKVESAPADDDSNAH
jgi:tetratricopeptide (TPR) repeat protein